MCEDNPLAGNCEECPLRFISVRCPGYLHCRLREKVI